jgi:hypothetical protein
MNNQSINQPIDSMIGLAVRVAVVGGGAMMHDYDDGIVEMRRAPRFD